MKTEYPSALDDFYKLRNLLLDKAIRMREEDFLKYSESCHMSNIALSLAIIADKMTKEDRKEAE